MFQDRRSYPRHKAMLSLKVLFGDAELNCVAIDVSPTGAFFVARNSPPIDTTVDIIVRPTGVKIPPVRLNAQIVRVNAVGGGSQPGFAVRFLTAHGDSGRGPIFHVLRHVLQLTEISPEHLPDDSVIVFRFPEIGEQMNLQSARRRRSVTNADSGPRLTGRPLTPIEDAMPRDRRGKPMKSPASPPPSRRDDPRHRPSDPRLRRSSELSRPRAGDTSHGESTELPTAPQIAREPTELPAPPMPTSAAHRAAGAQTTGRRVSAAQYNAFSHARPTRPDGDSGIFLPPGSAQPGSAQPGSAQPGSAHSVSAQPTGHPAARPPAIQPTPAFSANPTFAPKPALSSNSDKAPSAPSATTRLPPTIAAAKRPAAEASFDLEQPEVSRSFGGKRPETSRIVAPFTNQSSPTTRRRSTASSWSVYEPDTQQRSSARRTSEAVIQDDPFATGARKMAARFREKAEQERDQRRSDREHERELLRAKLDLRRRETGPSGATFGVDGDGGERSMIFARNGATSSIGGPMLTGMSASPGLPENTTVAVQTPVTYELDGRFVPGMLVSAAPLALEIHSTDQVPQLDQALIVNLPVRHEDRWRTIFLVGKLLRLPERRDGGQSFVLHIERVQEGEIAGAYNRFLTSDHASSP